MDLCASLLRNKFQNFAVNIFEFTKFLTKHIFDEMLCIGLNNPICKQHVSQSHESMCKIYNHLPLCNIQKLPFHRVDHPYLDSIKKKTIL